MATKVRQYDIYAIKKLLSFSRQSGPTQTAPASSKTQGKTPQQPQPATPQQPQEVKIELVASGNTKTHSLVCMSLSNNYLVFRFVGASGIPEEKTFHWYSTVQMHIISMDWDPTATRLLVLTADMTIAIIPVYFLMFGEQPDPSLPDPPPSSQTKKQPNPSSSSSSSSSSRKPGQAAPTLMEDRLGRFDQVTFIRTIEKGHPISYGNILWWRTSNGKEDYAITCTSNGTIRFINLQTKQNESAAQMRLGRRVQKIELFEQYHSRSKHLLLHCFQTDDSPYVVGGNINRNSGTIKLSQNIPGVVGSMLGEVGNTFVRVINSHVESPSVSPTNSLNNLGNASSSSSGSSGAAQPASSQIPFLQQTLTLLLEQENSKGSSLNFVKTAKSGQKPWGLQELKVSMASPKSWRSVHQTKKGNQTQSLAEYCCHSKRLMIYSQLELKNPVFIYQLNPSVRFVHMNERLIFTFVIDESRNTSTIRVISKIISNSCTELEGSSTADSLLQTFKLDGQIIGCCKNFEPPRSRPNFSSASFSSSSSSSSNGTFSSLQDSSNALQGFYFWTHNTLYECILKSSQQIEQIFFHLVANGEARDQAEKFGKSLELNILSLFEQAGDLYFEKNAGNAFEMYHLADVNPFKFISKFTSIARFDTTIKYLTSRLKDPKTLSPKEGLTLSHLLLLCYLQRMLETSAEYPGLENNFYDFLSSNRLYDPEFALQHLLRNGLVDIFLFVATQRNCYGRALQLLGSFSHLLNREIAQTVLLRLLDAIQTNTDSFKDTFPSSPALPIAPSAPSVSSSSSGIPSSFSSANPSPLPSPTSHGPARSLMVNLQSNSLSNSSSSSLPIEDKYVEPAAESVKSDWSMFLQVENSLMRILSPDQQVAVLLSDLSSTLWNKTSSLMTREIRRKVRKIMQLIPHLNVTSLTRIIQLFDPLGQQIIELQRLDSNFASYYSRILETFIEALLAACFHHRVFLATELVKQRKLTAQEPESTQSSSSSSSFSSSSCSAGKPQVNEQPSKSKKLQDLEKKLRRLSLPVPSLPENRLSLSKKEKRASGLFESDKKASSQALRISSLANSLDREIGPDDHLVEKKVSRKIIKFSCGSSHCIALTDKGQVYGWGLNAEGQIGIANASRVDVPTIIPGLQAIQIIEISCGLSHSIAIDNTGAAYSWGDGSMGQLGLGSFIEVVSQPKPIHTSFPVVWKKAACGFHHTMLLSADGHIFSFGNGDMGQLGIGDYVNKNTPTQVPFISNATQISCGSHHSACLTDGQIYTWGCGSFGQLGHGTRDNQLKPTRVDDMGKRTIVYICCGGMTTIAVSSLNIVFCWGKAPTARSKSRSNASGTSEKNEILVPSSLGKIPQNICAVASGFSHLLALTTFKNLFVWGDNSEGQLGFPTFKAETSSASSSSSASLATSSGARVYGPGARSISDAIDFVNNPTKLSLQNGLCFVSIDCGDMFSAALTETGQLYTWGSNSHGQLGTGDYQSRHQPTLIEFYETVKYRTLDLPDGADPSSTTSLSDSVFSSALPTGLSGLLGRSLSGSVNPSSISNWASKGVPRTNVPTSEEISLLSSSIPKFAVEQPLSLSLIDTSSPLHTSQLSIASNDVEQKLQALLEKTLRDKFRKYRPTVVLYKCIDWKNWIGASIIYELTGEWCSSFECRLQMISPSVPVSEKLEFIASLLDFYLHRVTIPDPCSPSPSSSPYSSQTSCFAPPVDVDPEYVELQNRLLTAFLDYCLDTLIPIEDVEKLLKSRLREWSTFLQNLITSDYSSHPLLLKLSNDLYFSLIRQSSIDNEEDEEERDASSSVGEKDERKELIEELLSLINTNVSKFKGITISEEPSGVHRSVTVPPVTLRQDKPRPDTLVFSCGHWFAQKDFYRLLQTFEKEASTLDHAIGPVCLKLVLEEYRKPFISLSCPNCLLSSLRQSFV